MILVDTSVWIHHFRGSSASRDLAALLDADEVLMHPFVRGELALGSLGARRAEVLRDLALLTSAPHVPDEDVLEMVNARRLTGSGIGWVDAHLLASAVQSNAVLWTFDRPLSRILARLQIGR